MVDLTEAMELGRRSAGVVISTEMFADEPLSLRHFEHIYYTGFPRVEILCREGHFRADSPEQAAILEEGLRRWGIELWSLVSSVCDATESGISTFSREAELLTRMGGRLLILAEGCAAANDAKSLGRLVGIASRHDLELAVTNPSAPPAAPCGVCLDMTPLTDADAAIRAAAGRLKLLRVAEQMRDVVRQALTDTGFLGAVVYAGPYLRGYKVNQIVGSVTGTDSLISDLGDPEAFGKSALRKGNTTAPRIAEMRSHFLDSISELRESRTGRTSFNVHDWPLGKKVTLLDIEGRGHLDHIWSAWIGHEIKLHFTIDGEPAFQASPLELCNAQVEECPTPFPAFACKHYSLNSYLPFYFNKSLRVEAVHDDRPHVDVTDGYFQLDYTLDETTQQPRQEVSHRDGRLHVRYDSMPQKPRPVHDALPRQLTSDEITVSPNDSAEFLKIDGPGTIAELAITSDWLDLLHLRIYWDGERDASVDAPLRYFFGYFQTIGIERTRPDEARCHFPMPFGKEARIEIANSQNRLIKAALKVEYHTAPIETDTGYFHARFCGTRTDGADGAIGHTFLSARGRGHLVGLNLYDYGHDHSGGDLFLIDGGTSRANVIKGCNGEDWGSFASFTYGLETPYAGALSAQERYRFYFESPIAFTESLTGIWEIFDGAHAKSVAFWYQTEPHLPMEAFYDPDFRALPPTQSVDSAVAPWLVVGPFRTPDSLDDPLPGENNAPGDQVYKGAICNFTHPFLEKDHHSDFAARWRRVTSVDHILDLTTQERYYWPRRCQLDGVRWGGAWLARTHVTSPEAREATLLVGHDDPLRIALNGERVYSSEGGSGFGLYGKQKIALRAGRNTFSVRVSNFANVNFGWCGFLLRLVDETGSPLDNLCWEIHA